MAFFATCGTLIALTAIIATQWRQIRQAQLDNNLKRDMLDRGMSADEIARVINTAGSQEAVPYPSPSEVVVEWEGDWYPAIVTKTDGEKYFVHYKGYDEEEWVTLDRIRFPAQTQPLTRVSQGQTA